MSKVWRWTIRFLEWGGPLGSFYFGFSSVAIEVQVFSLSNSVPPSAPVVSRHVMAEKERVTKALIVCLLLGILGRKYSLWQVSRLG